MLWLLSAVNRESGCVTAHSGRTRARTRVREQHPWGVGGNSNTPPRDTLWIYCAARAPGPGRPGRVCRVRRAEAARLGET